MIKNNPNHSKYILNPENNQLVNICGLYWIEQTPAGPIITKAMSEKDAIENNEEFLNSRKDAFTFKEATKVIKEWYLERAIIFDQMSEEEFEKMTSSLENNRAEIDRLRKIVEDIKDNGKVKREAIDEDGLEDEESSRRVVDLKEIIEDKKTEPN